MAGIGFELRRLSQQQTLSALLGAFGHAAVIAAGPWLFTIISLATISLISEQVTGLAKLATFRAIIIYAFAVSLVLTAPVTIVATRLVADALWLKKPERVRPLLYGAYVTAIAVVSTGVAALALYFRMTPVLGVALLASSLTVALIWVALSFCGAVRDYRGVTIAFATGLFTSVLAGTAAAIMGLSAAGIAWGFVAGLGLTFLLLTLRVLDTFPARLDRPELGFDMILGGFRTYRYLALGALAGTAAVWIDKWIFWFSPIGEVVVGGLVHAPLYDSAMFIASLVIIPALAVFVVQLETDFFERYQHYFSTIANHGTLRQIERARGRLAAFTLDQLVLVTVMQVGICAVLVLLAPLIVEFLSLQFQQISILRYGALGAVFQFIFISSTSMLLFFDRRRLYLALQVLFLGLNAGLTLLSVHLGETYFGVGYFAACLIASFVAYLAADRTFDRLNFLTFLGNNPSIRAATNSARRRQLLSHLARQRRGLSPNTDQG
ncbi:MAG: exopolysaccharide Pel transporter PelG [Hyphomicrobiaceae bacterium]|nr:exopolysaccharide Pel transporter PelG [Hyphomicrobiaceae bacterium]